MKKLNKNFHEQTRTVEAMRGTCSYYGACSCASVSCPCSDYTTNNYRTYQNLYDNHTFSFKQASF